MQGLPHEFEAFKRRAWPVADQFIWTHKGCKFSALQPRKEEINIYDIAQGLSRKFRFAGQADIDYTVAQHSVAVSLLLDENVEMALWGLLHDAAEAWLPDWPTPFKRAQAWFDPEFCRFLSFEEIEHSIMGVIAELFDLQGCVEPAVVHEADLDHRNQEWRDLYPSDHPARLALGKPTTLPSIQIPTWTPAEAKQKFLNHFEYLMDRRQYIANGK